MKRFTLAALALALGAVVLFSPAVGACDEPSPQQAPKISKLPPSALKSAAPATQAELDFLANGPKLFTMDKALALSRETGKPVICWMGPNLFADERARALSTELGDTTIQAVMDDDGETGKLDPATGKRIPAHRVKFSSGNYEPTAKVAYIPLDKFDRKGTAEAILKFARGGR